MALGKVKVQGGWGRRGGTGRTKGQECMHFVSTLVSTAWRMGFRLRVEGWWPPRDSVLKRSPVAKEYQRRGRVAARARLG